MAMVAGVIGLGSMGMGMACSLQRSGIETYGLDTVDERVSAFVEQGGKTGALADCAGILDAVVLVVVNAAQTRDVLLGDDAILPRLKAGAVVLSCATVSPEFAREMEAACHAREVLYLDAPISGGAVKAAAGKLSILASGAPAAFDAAQPVLDAMAETVFRLGDEAGPGSAMKVINQLLAGVHIAAAAEAITFGVSQGVSPQQAVEVISQCAGTSWMFENRGPHIASGDYTPHSAVEIFVKDLGIVSDIARVARFPAPLAAAALQQFLAASGMGHGREDDSAVAKVYARAAGLTLPGETS